MRTRLERANKIFNERRVSEILDIVRIFEVEGDKGDLYLVKVFTNKNMSCTRSTGEPCPDRAPFCKHKLAVMEYMNKY